MFTAPVSSGVFQVRFRGRALAFAFCTVLPLNFLSCCCLRSYISLRLICDDPCLSFSSIDGSWGFVYGALPVPCTIRGSPYTWSRVSGSVSSRTARLLTSLAYHSCWFLSASAHISLPTLGFVCSNRSAKLGWCFCQLNSKASYFWPSSSLILAIVSISKPFETNRPSCRI